MVGAALAGVVGVGVLASVVAGSGSNSEADLQIAAAPEVVTTTAVSPTTSTTAQPAAVADVEILALLDTLTVADPEQGRAPYERDHYQPGGWGDVDGDCQSTRHEVLIESSLSPVTLTASGCRVATGQWLDPYTNQTLTTAEAATIDHFIPLAEAHRSGAWRWDRSTKEQFGNDMESGQLVVVGGDVNQAKGDKTPDKWLPPIETSHCAYAAKWVSVKARWELTVTARERDALAETLSSCAFEPQGFVDAPTEPEIVTTIPPVVSTTTIVVTTTGGVELLSCDRRAERVVIANTAAEAVPLAGWILHDEGDKHRTRKSQNVWNNDGDIANLVAPNGVVQMVRCS